MRRTLFIGHITLFGTCLHADARFLQLCNFSLLQGEASTSLSQIRFHSEVTVMAVIRLFFAGRAVDPVFMSRISLLKYHTMMSGKSWKSNFSVRTWTRLWWWRNVWFVVIFVRMIMMVLIMMVLIDRDYQHTAATCTAIHFNHQNITSRGDDSHRQSKKHFEEIIIVVISLFSLPKRIHSRWWMAAAVAVVVEVTI